MEIQKIFLVLSVIFTLGAYVPYIAQILKSSEVRPNRASWFVWWIIDGAMTVVLFASREYTGALLFASFTVGTTIVLALSLRKGEGQFERMDWVYIAIAILGVILWQSSADKNPVLSVVANMFAATMGTIPTLRKAIRNPDSEDSLTWKLFWTGGLFNTLAITKFTFVSASGTIAVWILQWAINLSIYLGRVLKVRREERFLNEMSRRLEERV